MGCAIKNRDGSECKNPVSHHWGTVEFCCEHFDSFVWGSIVPRREKEKEYKPSHLEIIQEYESRTGRDCKLPGTPCQAEKKKEGE